MKRKPNHQQDTPPFSSSPEHKIREYLQLQSLRALHAPVDNLLSNEAYMLMTSLAWNLKAWLGLSLPEPASEGPQREVRRREKHALLKMEFRTFLNYFIRVPAQVLKTGRRLIVRLMAWNT